MNTASAKLCCCATDFCIVVVFDAQNQIVSMNEAGQINVIEKWFTIQQVHTKLVCVHLVLQLQGCATGI